MPRGLHKSPGLIVFTHVLSELYTHVHCEAGGDGVRYVHHRVSPVSQTHGAPDPYQTPSRVGGELARELRLAASAGFIDR